MSTDLKELQQVWEANAQADPLWAVLSDPDRRGRRWDLESFLQTGEDFVAKVLHTFEELGAYPGSGLAVDFGCGVGRLTQPLADRFERTIGIDISETMLAIARRINRHGDRVVYQLNDRPDLSLLPDDCADFVMSFITLQHMEPGLARAYLQEFFRILKPGGLLLFQIPSHLTDAYLPAVRTDEPVPTDACAAELRVSLSETRAVAGAKVNVAVEVTNRSNTSWVQSAVYPLHVGNHWMNDGGMVVLDDGRARLPGRLEPGERTTVALEVAVPPLPGVYRLEVDVVQEGVRWFADAGSTPGMATVEVIAAAQTTVSPSGDQAAAPQAPTTGHSYLDVLPASALEPPMFAMHGIPRADVEHIVQRHGGRVLLAEEYVTEWFSYNYYVQTGPTVPPGAPDTPPA